jgi:ABC-type Fe3+-hydroxamate transport system substrate-binding protein
MPTSIDQLGNTINISAYPKRIISLVPSQTEFLFDIGLDDEIVGITRFCIHPESKVNGRAKIGGTKQFNFDKIHALQPDLIIGNKEENYYEGITELQKHYPVWMSDIFTLSDAYDMMLKISALVGKATAGEEMVNRISSGFHNWQNPVADIPKIAAYFIWRKPYMVAANNTFINHMLGKFGLQNVFAGLERYPEIDPVQLSELKPDYILLSSEPYSFSEKHFDEYRAFSPYSKVALIDGEIFSWYGSRLLHAPAYFRQLQNNLLV